MRIKRRIFLDTCPQIGYTIGMTKIRPKISNIAIEDSYFYLCCLHELGIDPLARELYLTGEPEADKDPSGEPGVEYTMASRFIKNLRALNLDSDRSILIHMKTCGGYWMEGMAIYDAIKASSSYVTILNYTHARSMSSLILQAADLRVMMPNSEFMFHHGEYAGQGELVTVMSDLDWYKRSIERMCDIYIEVMRTSPKSIWVNLSEKRIRHWLMEQMAKKNNVFLSAEEAVKNGFADAVFDGDWEALK